MRLIFLSGNIFTSIMDHIFSCHNLLYPRNGSAKKSITVRDFRVWVWIILRRKTIYAQEIQTNYSIFVNNSSSDIRGRIPAKIIDSLQTIHRHKHSMLSINPIGKYWHNNCISENVKMERNVIMGLLTKIRLKV